MVQNVQVLHHILVSKPVASETHELIEDAERITQAAIRFLGDGVKRLRLGFNALFLGDLREVLGDIRYRDPAEIEDLASRQDRW